MPYLQEILIVLFRNGAERLVWLIFSVFFGIGIFADYDKIKIAFQKSFNISLPNEFPMMWLTLAIFIWLTLSLAHRETLLRIRAGRIVIEPPNIIPNVPLYNRVRMVPANVVVSSNLIGTNDIVNVVIKNQPREMASGKSIIDAFASVSIYRLENGYKLFDFDFARWMDNEKPGYEGNPGDRYVDEWKYRTIKPNSSPNRLDFIVKTRDEDNAYGFRGHSQLQPQWHDNDLLIPPGRYKILLTISGSGMTEPYIACYEFRNNGAGQEMDIRRTDRGLSSQWLQA